MKKLLVMSLAMLSLSLSHAVWYPYTQGNVGISAFSDNAKEGLISELRLGAYKGSDSLSLGYLRNDNSTDGERLTGGDLTLNTINFQWAKEIFAQKGLSFKLSVAGGLTVPNLENGASETLSSGVSGAFGGALDYKLTNNWSVGTGLRYFAFRSNLKKTEYLTETETVFADGTPIGTVETVTPRFSENELSFNSLMLTAGVTYKF